MCPQRFVPKSFNAVKLATLQQVFDETWKALSARYSFRDRRKEQDIRTSLAKTIVAEASRGQFNPDKLRRVAMKHLRDAGMLPRNKPRANSE